MKLNEIRSDAIYKKMMRANQEQKKEIYRNELMRPFAFKWKCVGIAIDGDTGYDVISTSTMGGGYHPDAITQDRKSEIDVISDDEFWEKCYQSIENSLKGFEKQGIELPVKEYLYTIMLNDPKNPMSEMTGDYCGDGGIPGYIIGTIIPNTKSKEMLPVALAHETNHNVRWQFQKWSDKVTLADMIVSEGLAENFAAMLYGEDKIGMWVRNTSEEMLKQTIIPAIKQHLKDTHFNRISAYLYGDEIMKLRQGITVGMPYCAGYACGYALIKYYLKKTGVNIYKASILSTEEILQEVEEFFS